MSDRVVMYAIGICVGLLATVVIRWALRSIFRGQPEARRRR
jgi:ABC-type arginine transport system permease subunit